MTSYRPRHGSCGNPRAGVRHERYGTGPGCGQAAAMPKSWRWQDGNQRFGRRHLNAEMKRRGRCNLLAGGGVSFTICHECSAIAESGEFALSVLPRFLPRTSIRYPPSNWPDHFGPSSAMIGAGAYGEENCSVSGDTPKPAPPQSPFVSNDEMVELTGYKSYSAQARWLKENDFHFVTNVAGRPVVHRAHMAFRMGVPMAVFEESFPPPSRKWEPNVQALMDSFGRKRPKLRLDPPPIRTKTQKPSSWHPHSSRRMIRIGARNTSDSGNRSRQSKRYFYVHWFLSMASGGQSCNSLRAKAASGLSAVSKRSPPLSGWRFR